MGDALLPLADSGPTGLFYNPAGLAKIQKPTFEPINLETGFNSGFIRTMSTSNFYNAPSLSGYADTLRSNPGTLVGTHGAFFPSFSMRGFSIGVLGQGSVRGESKANRLYYSSKYQLIPAVGFGFSLAHGIVRVGYSFQWVSQASGDANTTASTGAGYDRGLKEGSALSHNLGLALTFPVAYVPSFTVVARNVGGARYNAGKIVALSHDSTGSPADEMISADAGFSISPKVGAHSTFNFAMVARDISNRSKISWMARLAAGMELEIHRKIYLRAGYGSGYPSAGVGVRTERGELNLAWFSDETTHSLHGKRDMRFMLQYQMRFY